MVALLIVVLIIVGLLAAKLIRLCATLETTWNTVTTRMEDASREAKASASMLRAGVHEVGVLAEADRAKIGRLLLLGERILTQATEAAATSGRNEVAAALVASDLVVAQVAVDGVAANLVTAKTAVEGVASDLVTAKGIVEGVASDLVTAKTAVEGVATDLAADRVTTAGVASDLAASHERATHAEGEPGSAADAASILPE